MQYSICSFSQAEITRFNDKNPEYAIDPVDIFIFQWFKDFIVNTVTKRIDNKDYKGMWMHESKGRTYFNIRYNAIIDDFPILKSQSVRSIQRRFDKYVHGGLLVKKTVSHGKRGLFTYFCLTDLFKSFYMDSSNPEHKVNPHSENKKVASDKNVVSNDVANDKNVVRLIYNPSTNINPSTTSSTSTEFTKSENVKTENQSSAEEADFSKTITKLFGFNPMFNPNPYPVLIQHMSLCGLSRDCMTEYLEYVFKILQKNCRQQDKFVSYFFKSFTSEVYMAQFRYEKAKNEKIIEDQKITCPVCYTVHDKYSDCPECELSYANMNDEKSLNFARKFSMLPHETKNTFRIARRKLEKDSTLDLTKRMAFYQQLLHEYKLE